MQKILFIDRDGTILIEPADEQIDSFEKMSFLPGVITALVKIVKYTDYMLIMVTNQDGLGTSLFPEKKFWPVHNLMLDILKNEGVLFDAIHIDTSLPRENARTRKPGTGMLTKYMDGSCDLKNSYVIGDRKSDIELAKNLGSGMIYVGKKKYKSVSLVTDNWDKIYRFLRFPDRRATVRRKTNETEISLDLNLDGVGRFDLNSGIGFFDHMLELLVRHASLDLTGRIAGDLHVDEHHTVEDTAIVFGQAIFEALGSKKNIQRYGFLLPMDESRAEVALDFSGRNELVWRVKFNRPIIGKMPTELFQHFFKSFTDHARCNLYIKARGKNEHHKIEAVFKAVGRVIRQAALRDENIETVPSTKGVL
jgi:imidazoleglycerol-phosphate dehydratase/histidinol-phosphatase